MGIFLVLIIVLWALMQTPIFQDWIQGIFVKEVGNSTGKLVSINYLMIDILGNVQGKQFLLCDSISKDTFVYVPSFKIDINISQLFSGQIFIKMLEVNDAVINIQKINHQHWNYENIINKNVPDMSSGRSFQINDITANRLKINVVDYQQMEHHISLLKVAYKKKQSLFSKNATSNTLIESLDWKMAYRPSDSKIDYEKIWNEIIAFSPTQAIALAKNNILSIYQSNVVIQDIETKKSIVSLSKLKLQTTPLKNGFKTLSNFIINNIPIDLKFDVEETKNQKLSCNNFEIKSLKSMLNMDINLSKKNDLYSNIKATLNEKDIQMILPQYVLQQPIQMDMIWQGNFDTGIANIKLQIPKYIDLSLNNQYVKKDAHYAFYQEIEQCKLYCFSDTEKMTILYPKFKKWYKYFTIDEMDIKGEGYWYNNAWTMNAQLKQKRGYISINGSKPKNSKDYFNGATIRLDIDSFCFGSIFNKEIYNTRIVMNFDTLQNKIQSHIDKIRLKDYVWSGIAITNISQHKSNFLTIDVQDKNIRGNASLEYQNISQNHTFFKIKSTLENVKIDELRDMTMEVFGDSSLLIFRDSVSVFGKIDATIEDINHIKNITLQSPILALYTYRKDDYFYWHNIEFDYRETENSEINIVLKNNLVNGVLQFNKTDFELQHIINNFANTYITNYTFASIDKKDTILSDFKLSLQAYNLQRLNRYFIYPLRNLDTLDINIAYTKSEKKLSTNLLLKNLRYATMSIENMTVNNEGKDSNLDFEITMKHLLIDNNSWVSAGKIQIQIQRNELLLDIVTDSFGKLGNIHLNNELSFLDKSICLKVNDISIDFLNRKYRTLQKGIFYWGENLLVSDNFLAVRELGKHEQFIIRPVYDDEGKKETIQFTLSQVDISVLNQILKSYNTKLGGIFNIQGNLRNLFNKQAITIDYNGNLRDFELNDVFMGNMMFTGNFYPMRKDIYYDLENDNADFEISSTGHINFGDKIHDGYSDIVLNMMRFPIGFIQPYLTDIFDYADANVQGKIIFSQRKNKMSINGKLDIPKVLLRISYTQVDYIVDSLKVMFQDSTISFAETRFRDYESNQDNGYIKGDFLQTNLFSNLQYGIHIKTNGIMVFNTDVKTGDVYSLVAKAKGTFDLTGNHKKIFLRAKAYPLEGAKVIVYSSRSIGNNSLGSFITFKKHNSETMVSDKDSISTLTMDILVDVDAQSIIGADIWTSSSGDQTIQTEGMGTLRIVSNPQNPFGLYGRYNISKGSYNLPIEYTEKLLLVDPRFNNYIEWTGDVNGKININLIYNIPNADFNALISSSTSNTATTNLVPDQFKNFKGPVDILMKVSNSILSPSFKLDLEIPPNNVLRNNPDTKTFFDRVQNNETELLRQVSYLFITNSFAPPDNVINSSVLVSGVTGAVSSALSSQLNNLLSKPFAKIAPTLKFNLITDVYGSNNTTTSGATNTAIDRMRVGASVSQSLFDNRFSYSVSTAGDFGFGNTNNKAAFLPDAEARYNIKKDGSIYIRAFINNSVSQGENYSYGKNSRQGGGIGFRKEFNSIKDLFTFNKDTTNKKNKKSKIPKDTLKEKD